MKSARRRPTRTAVMVGVVMLLLSSCGGGGAGDTVVLSSGAPASRALSGSPAGAEVGSSSGAGSDYSSGAGSDFSSGSSSGTGSDSASGAGSVPAPSPSSTVLPSDAPLPSASPASGSDQENSPPQLTTTVAASPDPTSAATSGPIGFRSTISEIDDALAQRMAASWRKGCPVPLDRLRYLTMTYRGFDGADHPGELVVAATVAEDVVSAFRTLYDTGYPIASMRLVDDFGADDDASMDADNTSAFNCRAVTGGSTFSEHSYGTAVDLNPVENPYVRGGTVLPAAGADFTSRPDRPGVIQADGAVVGAFAAIGWSWGGAWSDPVDYQHFSLSGR